MKRIALLLPVLFLLAACSGPSYMLQKEGTMDIRTVKPVAGKSALVVARTTFVGFAIEFDTFLDYNMIGVTKGRGFFVKNDVEPGVHYLIARAESLETGKIDFKPDTVYYVQQTPRVGWWRARITLTPVTAEHLMSEMDEKCVQMEYDAKNPGPRLTEHEYNEAVTDYEREITEGYHKDFTDYRGFKVQ